MQLFTGRRFAEASAAFREAAAGPAADIADKARSYAQICNRRTSDSKPEFSSAEDHFTYAVARMNAGDIEQARAHLNRGLALKPDADHALYTLALCCALSGDGGSACENLKRAISIDPRNRILARQDPEFAPLLGRIPGLRALLSEDVA
jgi:tetratricopeptide (TPR) repeat protein